MDAVVASPTDGKPCGLLQEVLASSEYMMDVRGTFRLANPADREAFLEDLRP